MLTGNIFLLYWWHGRPVISDVVWKSWGQSWKLGHGWNFLSCFCFRHSHPINIALNFCIGYLMEGKGDERKTGDFQNLADILRNYRTNGTGSLSVRPPLALKSLGWILCILLAIWRSCMHWFSFWVKDPYLWLRILYYCITEF